MPQPHSDAGSRNVARCGFDLCHAHSCFAGPADVQRRFGKIADEPARDNRVVGRARRIEEAFGGLVSLGVPARSERGGIRPDCANATVRFAPVGNAMRSAREGCQLRSAGRPKFCGSGEPLVRSIRIPLWSKLTSNMEQLTSKRNEASCRAQRTLIPPGSGFTLDNATAINDDGQIIASGSNAQGTGARVPAHPASVRAQDLPPARLIHAGRTARCGEPGIVHTI